MSKKEIFSKVTKRLIIVIWLALIFCYIIKLFGGNYFEKFSTNQRFIDLCYFIDNNIFANIIVSFFTSYTLYILYYLSISKKWFFSKKINLLFIPYIFIFVLARIFIQDIFVSYVFDVIQFLIIPFILFKKFLKVIVIFMKLSVFMLIILSIENLGFKYIGSNSLLNLLSILEIYLFLFIIYLQNNTKEKEDYNMGLWLQQFFGKSSSQLMAYKKTLENKHDSKIKTIDKKISKIIQLENKNK